MQHTEQQQKILIVDDSLDHQVIIQKMLEAMPFQLSFASDGKQAVERVEKESFDLIIMDIEMPEMDGLQAASAIRERQKREFQVATPILGLSSRTPDSIPEDCAFSTYLCKPVSADDLVAEIGKLTHPKSPAARAILESVQKMKKRMAELAPAYLENRKKELADLGAVLATKNFRAIESLGHKLKGTAASYGFPALGMIGGELEEAAKRRDLDALALLVENTIMRLSV